MNDYSKKFSVAVITSLLVGEDLSTGSVPVLDVISKVLVDIGATFLYSSADRGVEWVAEEISRNSRFSVAFSPASNKEEHHRVYRLESAAASITVYTGAGDVAHVHNMASSADLVVVPFFSDRILPVVDNVLSTGCNLLILSEKEDSLVKKKIREFHPHLNIDESKILIRKDPQALRLALDLSKSR